MKYILNVQPDYYVNEKGEIYKLKTGKRMKTTIARCGYEKFRAGPRDNRKCLRVHRLVAMAFIPNPDNLPEVHHKDTDKTNNHVDNLMWVNKLGNERHGAYVDLKHEKKNSTGYQGVQKRKNGTFSFTTHTGGHYMKLYGFATARAAHKAYMKVVELIHQKEGFVMPE